MLSSHQTKMDKSILLRRLIFYSLVAFFSTNTALKLLYSWFRKRGSFFYTNTHQKPEALNECNDGFAQLSIFVHGFPSFFYCWRFQLRHFQRDYHVVALDMRGYNESDKPHGVHNYSVDKVSADIIEFIEKFGGNVNLVGHDWGAVICWSVALRRPDLIHKLIIMNVPEPRAFREVISSSYKQVLSSWYMFMFQVPQLAEAVFSAEDFKLLVFVIKKAIKDAKNFTDQDAECYKYAFSGPYGVTAPINYYRAANRILDNTPAKVGLVKPKTLIVWGALDTALTVEGAHASLKYCEQAELKILPTASHFVHEDEPDKVNQYVEEFLNQN